MKKLSRLLCFLLAFSFISTLDAGRRAEEEFWSQEDNKEYSKKTGLTNYPQDSIVQAGLVAYGNYGDGEDEFTAGFKISASFRDYFEYLFFRADGMLGIGGPAEGMAEAQFVLLRGLVAGLGGSYTKRLNFSPRFGLYVEDQTNKSRRGGFYLAKDSSGGIEVNWEFNQQWDFNVDLGVEKDNNDKYNRFVIGMLYKF